jgi:hypothetical protein
MSAFCLSCRRCEALTGILYWPKSLQLLQLEGCSSLCILGDGLSRLTGLTHISLQRECSCKQAVIVPLGMVLVGPGLAITPFNAARVFLQAPYHHESADAA